MKRKALLGFAFLSLLLFPYGPLFPWSPLKPGFERLKLQSADIYYRTGTALDPAYRKADEYIADSERFHRLPVRRRITIVHCNDWSTFRRFMPHVSSRAVGAFTLVTGTVIYVTPRVAERGLDPGEFLRHEISHATLHQNQSLVDAYRIGTEVQWLSEGIAVAYGKQKAYYTHEDFLNRIRREEVAPFIDPSRRAEIPGIYDIRYAYVVWRNFNEYLMGSKGRDNYQSYLEACMKSPRQWRELFPHHFNGLTFEAATADFQRDTRRLAAPEEGAADSEKKRQ